VKVFIVLVIICSCTVIKKSPMQRRSLDQYFLSNGESHHKLSQLPMWANFSSVGKCRREKNITYFDFRSLRKSFNLSYEQAVQLQLAYNDAYFRLEESESTETLSLEAQEKLFIEAKQKVSGNLKVFNSPLYNKVSLIWIDPLLKRKGDIARALKKSHVQSGHPTLLSFCLTRIELEKLLINEEGTNSSLRYITAEMMSPFGVKDQFEYDFAINLNNIFQKNKKITVFIPRGFKKPRQIKGRFSKKYL